MRNILLEFLRRGFVALGLGPLILVVVYLILQNQAGIETLSISQVCLSILSLSALAFIVGGMNAIYQVERLPLMVAILIHGIVLYFSYLITYLVNDWIEWGITPILVFTAIFIIGYLVIWAAIYFITRRDTERLNKVLDKKNNCIDS